MIKAISTNSLPTLIYFNGGKGRAGLPRLIFLINDVLFENKKINFLEYKKMRDEGLLPFDQLPILKLGNTTISQSCAIARYAAKLSNLYPEDFIKASFTDMVVETWRDFLDLLYACYVDRIIKNERLIMSMRSRLERLEKIQSFFEIIVPRYFNQFELMLGKYSNSVYLLESLTWADLAIFDLLCTIDPHNIAWKEPQSFYCIPTPVPYSPPLDLYSDYPRLLTLQKKLRENTKVAQWLAKNPY